MKYYFAKYTKFIFPPNLKICLIVLKITFKLWN